MPLYPQLGGASTFEFLNLNTSPRIIALGGYVGPVIDGDINNAIYNPSIINQDMNNKVNFNYVNYYSDISYGDIGYCFKFYNYNIISSMKFVDYGQFVETNEFGQEIGSFNAGEYVFSIGSSRPVKDSLFFIGLNTKFAHSSLYQFNSSAILFDFAVTYSHPEKDLTTSIIFNNIGYQFIPYAEGNQEPLPFEIALSISSKLEYMPLRWHLTLQHIETPDLFFDNPNSDFTEINNNFGYSLLRHVVFGSELLIHKNASILLGYNNRRRFEMVISDRKGLVGFSCGISFRVKRFHFSYARTSNHYSGPINTFGIVTNFNKID
tara:strand:+ start:464 stop:1426 length:963 start_codon:yes stop_codon:yes gene_type:complete